MMMVSTDYGSRDLITPASSAAMRRALAGPRFLAYAPEWVPTA